MKQNFFLSFFFKSLNYRKTTCESSVPLSTWFLFSEIQFYHGKCCHGKSTICVCVGVIMCNIKYAGKS